MFGLICVYRCSSVVPLVLETASRRSSTERQFCFAANVNALRAQAGQTRRANSTRARHPITGVAQREFVPYPMRETSGLMGGAESDGVVEVHPPLTVVSESNYDLRISGSRSGPIGQGNRRLSPARLPLSRTLSKCYYFPAVAVPSWNKSPNQ